MSSVEVEAKIEAVVGNRFPRKTTNGETWMVKGFVMEGNATLE